MQVAQKKLLSWWLKEARILPWREKISSTKLVNGVRETAIQSYLDSSGRDPYRVVVSEVMLQQTQVDRVKQKYIAWMEKWPKIENLSKASLAEVLIEWKGLGYNRRARFLWLLAQEIVNNRAGEWPSTEKELLKLPGIGRYTARAVMSFAFGQQVGVVDTNVKRIFQRVIGSDEKADFFQVADSLLPPDMADPWNQALMDFGALICTAKAPKCQICAIAEDCQANIQAKKEGFQNYAEKLAKTVKPKVKATGKDSKNGKKIPFEQTDRYLRGRIIDLLREKSLIESVLLNKLQQQFPQFTKERVLNQLQQLQKENMITNKDGTVCL